MQPSAQHLGRRSHLRIALATFLVALATFVLAPTSALASFQLGLEDNGFLDPAGSTPSQTAYGALKAVAGSTVRLYVSWGTIAPTGATEPAGFNPSDAGDSQYNWATLDAAVRTLASHHDRVVICLSGGPSPAWATLAGKPASLKQFTGSWNPNAKQFGLFAHAAAQRYSGTFVDSSGATLPRVSDWEIWNEENLPEDLMAPDVVSEYRSLLNAAYAGIKSVNSGDIVAIGGFAPVSFIQHVSVSPLTFAAELMCLRRVGTHFVRAGSCPSKAHFDVLAMHPYSLLATPTKHAYAYDDVLVGDMGKLVTLLHAAERLHTAVPNVKYGLWVTEWSWFTNPPNKLVGDSERTAARYTAYSMYEMWKAGASMVIWFSARDPSDSSKLPANGYGLSLYTSTGKPKLMLSAFRFPVVAGVSAGHGFVWGRAPVSRRTKVYVQQSTSRGWKRIATAQSGSDGVFEVHFGASRNGTYRAQVAHGPTSLAYNSTPIPPVRTHTS